jgi:quercetin dioxygenase-like cupin family protein
MTSSDRRLGAVVEAAADAYAKEGGVAASALVDLRRSASEAFGLTLEHGMPAPACLRQALGAMRPGKLKALLENYAPELPWIANEASLPGGLRRHTAYVEIVGPNGFALSDSLRFGLFLQMPESVYPSHSHAAEEFYYVLSGDARWQKDDREFRVMAPGSLIHHASWQRHAMTATSEPLLALWIWLGDLDMAKYKIDEA